MKLNFQDKLVKLKKVLLGQFKVDSNLDDAVTGMSIDVGMADNSNYALTRSVGMNPVYVGVTDSIGDIVATSELKALMKKSPNKVNARPIYNDETKRYDYHYSKVGVRDSDPFIPGQLFSPWLVSYFEDVFTKPLLYTNARKMCKVYSGSNPWARLMTLFLADFAGFASFKNSGTAGNKMTQDINVKSGMMTSVIINMNVTYSLEIEEREIAKTSDYPFANKMMSNKPQYAKYVLDLLEGYLIYYGNDATGTEGLLTVNSIDAWAGDSLTDIQADAANTTKGSTAYQYLYGIIMEFLAPSYNRFNIVNVALSPSAYNFLSFLPYSDSYDSRSVLAVLTENLSQNKDTENRNLEVNFYSDPLLAESTIFNAEVYDYMVITSPEVKTGPDEQTRDLIMCGIPLDEFVYPVIPGQYLQQHKMLKRYSGIFAPVAEAVKVISGFGV